MSAPDRSSAKGGEALPPATLLCFRSGDAAAFAAVMRAYQPLVRGAVARFFRGEFEREEAMQEVWLHLFQKRETLDPARLDSFSGWLAVLAQRRCIDLLRRPAEPAEELSEEAALEWLTARPEQEAAAQTAELLHAVEAFRARLRPLWRDFFNLYFVEGRDYEEIGEQLSIGRLRCKYMRKVLSLRARRSKTLIAALGRLGEGRDAS